MVDKHILEMLKKQAAADMAKWPQYQGHFDSYVLVRVKKEQKRKLGVAFAAGELAIAKPGFYCPEGGPYTNVRFVMVYSHRNRVDTSVAMSNVEFL